MPGEPLIFVEVALMGNIPGAIAEIIAEEREALDAYHFQLGKADKGLIRRIQPAGSPARYEDRAGDNHHHLICRRCGQVVDVDCAVGAAPCLTPADDEGYEIDEAEAEAQLGIMIGERDCWDQGYGTEALKLMIEHGFSTLNLNRISLFVYENNPRA